MKLLILHGPGINSSRQKLISLKSKFDTNNVMVFEKESDPKVIADYLTTPTLLPQEQLIVLENPPEDFVIDSSLITHYSSLILWFDHEIGEKKPVMEWVKKSNGQILYFPEAKEVSVFPFLDLLAEGNSRAFLEMKKLKEVNYDVFYFITMVFYLLRNLVNTPRNAPRFVRDKLKRQRAKFNQEKITNLYKDILDLDFKLKSGLIESEQAEFILTNKFME